MIDQQRAIELVYGILWHVPATNRAAFEARQALLDVLDCEARQRGVFAAQRILDTIRPPGKGLQ